MPKYKQVALSELSRVREREKRKFYLCGFVTNLRPVRNSTISGVPAMGCKFHIKPEKALKRIVNSHERSQHSFLIDGVPPAAGGEPRQSLFKR